MTLNGLPSLGVGLTYSSGIEEILSTDSTLVDVLEIEPQSHWYHSRRENQTYHIDESTIDRLSKWDGNKLLHGIGFPVGGTQLPDQAQIPPLLKTISMLNPPWISEHLNFNNVHHSHGNFKTGMMLPSRQTPEGASCATRSILSMMSDIPVPLAVETAVNYLRPDRNEMTDGEFVATVAEESGCGIVLDLHNIWTNERNGRQSVAEFLDQIPLDRVWEIHVAGGFERHGYWLDAHSGEMPQSVLELAQSVIPALPNLGAVIFEMFPAYLPAAGLDVIRKQLQILQTIWQQRKIPNNQILPPKYTPTASNVTHTDLNATPQEWEETLGGLVAGRQVSGAIAKELIKDPAIEIYRELLGEFRASMVVNSLRMTTRLLLLTMGTDGLKKLLSDYWQHATPETFASDEGACFGAYLESLDLEHPYIHEVSRYEKAVLEVLVDNEPKIVSFSFDPLPLLRALGEGRLPDDELTSGNYEIEITPDNANATQKIASVK